MVKSMLVFAGAVSLLVGAVFSQSLPAVQTARATAGIVLPVPPSDALNRLMQMRVRKFLRRSSDRKELDSLLFEAVNWASDSEATLDVWYASNHILTLAVKVSSAGDGRSTFEITANLPPSRLTASDKLLPGDVEHAETAVALIAADYIVQSFEPESHKSSNTRRELEESLGFNKDEIRAFRDRFNAALIGSYGQQVREAAYESEKDEQAEYERRHGLEHGEAPAAWQATVAAQRAREAAGRAWEEAQWGTGR